MAFDKIVNMLKMYLYCACTHTHTHTQYVSATRLFALLCLYLPHVEFQFFALKDVAVTASTLARTRCHASYHVSHTAADH